MQSSPSMLTKVLEIGAQAPQICLSQSVLNSLSPSRPARKALPSTPSGQYHAHKKPRVNQTPDIEQAMDTRLASFFDNSTMGLSHGHTD